MAPAWKGSQRAYVSKVNTRMKEAGKDPPADTNTNPMWKRIVSTAIAKAKPTRDAGVAIETTKHWSTLMNRPVTMLHGYGD